MLARKSRRFIGLLAIVAVAAAVACGGSDDSNGGGDDDGLADSGNGDATFGDGAGSDGSADGSNGGDGGTTLVCTPAAALVDSSHPDIVVGTGTPASCTAAALSDAVSHGGIITFSCGSAPVTITLTATLESSRGVESVEPGFDGGRDIVIDGNNLITLDANGAAGILLLDNFDSGVAASITLQRLTLTRSSGPAVQTTGPLTAVDCTFAANAGGLASTGPGTDIRVDESTFVDGGAASGAGIYASSGQVTITNSSFVGNQATSQSGGGALFVYKATVSLCGDVFRGNSASSRGGGISFSSDVIAPPYPTATIDRSVVDGNSVLAASLTCQGGGIDLQSYATTITNSTISGNAALPTTGGSAICSGGGIHSASGTVTFENLTVTGNRVPNDGTATNGQGGGIVASHGGSIRHCTIAGNQGVGLSGAILPDAGVTLDHTLVIDNLDMKRRPNCFLSFADGPRNFVDPGFDAGVDGGFECVPSEIVAGPRLGPLQDNGGPTLTMQPASGSPAETSGACAGTDQRGMPRSKCTSGAVEGL